MSALWLVEVRTPRLLMRAPNSRSRLDCLTRRRGSTLSSTPGPRSVPAQCARFSCVVIFFNLASGIVRSGISTPIVLSRGETPFGAKSTALLAFQVRALQASRAENNRREYPSDPEQTTHRSRGAPVAVSDSPLSLSWHAKRGDVRRALTQHLAFEPPLVSHYRFLLVQRVAFHSRCYPRSIFVLKKVKNCLLVCEAECAGG